MQLQGYPLLFSTIIGSKVMKANARIAGNSARQDLLYWNCCRLDHYKAVMKPFFGEKRAQNNFNCSYDSHCIDKPELECCDYLQKKRF